MEWIPVVEELPEYNVRVLVHTPDEDWTVHMAARHESGRGYHKGYSWCCPYATWSEGAVTHWMPLPEEPK